MRRNLAIFGAAVVLLGMAVPASSQQQQGWSATLEAESDPGLPLAWVTALAVDSRGRVYVTDNALDGIAVLAPELTLEREVGRKGEGPGEFEWPATIQILEDDSLYVWDGRRFRVTVFEALALAYTVSLSLESARELWRIPGQLGYVGLRSLPFYADQREEDHGRFDVLYRLGTDGDMESDSIYAVPAAEPLVVRGERSLMIGSHPFGAEPFLSLLGDDRIVYANSRVPTVLLLDLSGTVQDSFDVPMTPVPVSAAELRAAIDDNQQEGYEAFARVLEEGAPYMWPALTGLVVDDQQHIWVGGRARSETDKWEWVAFTREGTRVGSVLLPPGFRLYAVRDGKLFGVATDALDVPRIQLYRLDGGWGRAGNVCENRNSWASLSPSGPAARANCGATLQTMTCFRCNS